MLTNSKKNEIQISKRPSPYDFVTPGEYLVWAYRYQKEKAPGFSHRYLAAAMGYKSAAAFQDIVRGRVLPKKKALKEIQKIFQLDDEETKYLVLLFVLQNIRDPFFKEVVLGEVKKVLPKKDIC